MNLGELSLQPSREGQSHPSNATVTAPDRNKEQQTTEADFCDEKMLPTITNK